MKTRFLILYLILYFLPVDDFAYGDPGYVFHKIATNQGLSHSTVYTITQDHKGYIWFGTREGLNRYNSYDIKTYYANPEDSLGLDASEIRSLLSSKGHELYIGTTLGLSVYDYTLDQISRIKYQGQALSQVNDLLETSDQNIYVCSQKGFFLLDRERNLKQLIEDVPVLSITEYKENVFWLATKDEIMLVDQHGEVIKYYPYLKRSSDQFLSVADNISCIFKDSQGEIWIGTVRNGVYRYNTDKDTFAPIIPVHQDNPIEVNIVRAISEDASGNLWIGTESGLFVYDKNANSFTHYTQTLSNIPKALNDKAIYCIYKSQEDIMWLGTYFGGVNYVRPREKGFYTLKAYGEQQGLHGKAISQIMEDSLGRLWIGTEDGGINILNPENGTFQYLTHAVQKENSISCNNIHAIHNDGQGNVWIGTFLGGLNKYDIDRQQFTLYKNHQDDKYSLSNNHVYAILRDSRNTLWIGTQNGLNIYDDKHDSFIHFKPEYFSDKFIYDILEDREGNLWFCTRNSGIYFYDVQKDYIKSFTQKDGLSSDHIVCAYQDKSGRLWFGSLNGGLMGYNSVQQTFFSIGKKEGLPNNNIYGILEDGHGNLWVSTNKGLACYNPESKAIERFTIAHGLPNNQFNFKSSYKDQQGWMYFGTINGLCYFHPDSLHDNETAPKVHLTDLKLFNKSVKVKENGLLPVQIDEAKNIILKYKQNVITFEFVAINYFSPGNNTYAYYMEGFEETWNKSTHQRAATYTNLSPGHYTFHVKAANNDGVWSKERLVHVEVLPPFWLTRWALALYGFIILLCIYLYRRYLNAQHQQKMALQLERLEREKMDEVNQHKLNFFTYISHEFKTPLTLIIASVDKFLNNGVSLTEEKSELNLVKKNAARLHVLIEQLMEFRKTETDHATLHLSKGDVVLFLKDTFFAFQPLFTRKHIDYQAISNIKEYVTYFDADKLEKIITNLLSNAIKHTRDDGEIIMDIQVMQNIEKPEGMLTIKIIDSGIGLFEGETEKVFMPFYQGKHENWKTTGSGIGLALVQSLVKYLKGGIHIESTFEKGTTIIISLPLTDVMEKMTDKHKTVNGNQSLQIDQSLFYEENISDKEVKKETDIEESELLIVEDNKELLKFLVDHFSRFYRVSYASNGQAALVKIQRCMPDMIISDVMMPSMDMPAVDGIMLCKKIKANINTSHIPVILLTAKSTLQYKLEGLDGGADAYLPKPFNLKELELMVKNILDSSINMKRHFLKFGNLKDYEKPVNNQDQAFLNKLTDIMHNHLGDSDFNVTSFTKEAGISRTLLHLKLKKLVGLSASDFIKTIRIQHSAQLLKAGLSVSEVAFQVGFKDPSYFSRSFKEKFHVSPSEYKENELTPSEE